MYALPLNSPADSINRHLTYIYALRSVGVQVIEGKYKRRHRKCKALCEAPYVDQEEKETDVNIAVKLLEGALLNLYDRCFLLTADNDLAPAVRAVKEHCPTKQIILAPPPGARNFAELQRLCDKRITIKLRTIRANMLPDEVTVDQDYTGDGKVRYKQGEIIKNPYPGIAREAKSHTDSYVEIQRRVGPR